MGAAKTIDLGARMAADPSRSPTLRIEVRSPSIVEVGHQLELTCSHDGQVVSEIDWLEGELMIGRDLESGWCIDHPSVSRRHAAFWRAQSGRWGVRDLGSTNGVWVNRRRICEVLLDVDDRVEIGACNIAMRLVSSQADTAQAMELKDDILAQLSPRQLEVVLQVLAGRSNAEIADKLAITVRTVSSHLEQIYQRLQIRSRFELMRFVVRQ